MNGNARGNWNPREGQQPFRPNLNGTGDRITTLRRMLIGAVHLLSYGCYLIGAYLIGFILYRFILSYWFYLMFYLTISSFILLVHLLSYERALRLPTSFPISGLARLGVRPRLCRSSWRAFASTRPLMLPSTCSREALLALALFPPWNLRSFTVESSLSTPCSRSDPPLSRQGAALAHLDSFPPHDLVLWTDGSAPFPFDKGGSGVLVNCSLCGTEATLSFSAGPVCSSFSAEACAILHALCWSRQHQHVCLLSDSRSVLSSIFPFISNSVADLSSLSSCSIRLQWVPGHSFLPGNDAADELARRGALLAPSAIPCSLSPFISRIHSCLIWDWRRTVLSKLFDTQVPRFPPRNLCSLVMLTVSSLVFAATDTAFC